MNVFDFRDSIVMDEDEQDDGVVPKADNMLSFLITNWTGAQGVAPSNLAISLPLHDCERLGALLNPMATRKNVR